MQRTSHPASSPQLRRFIFVILVLLGFALRMGYGVVRYRSQILNLAGNTFISFWDHDARYHVLIAKAIASGEGYIVYELPGAKPIRYGGQPAVFKAPFYQYFLAAVFAVSGFSFLLFSPLQALMGGLTAGLIGLIALRIFRRPGAAWLAGIAAAIHPILVNSASQPYNEDLFFFLFVAAIWISLLWMESKRPPVALYCGALIGVGMLTRENASLLLIAIGTVLLLEMATSTMWKGYILMVAMTLAVVLPWTLHNWIQFHAVVPVASIMGVDFVDGNNDCVAAEGFLVPYWAEGRCPQVGENLTKLTAEMAFDPRTPAAVRLDQAGKRMALQFVKNHPVAYVKLALRRLWTSLLPYDPRGNQHRQERIVLLLYWLLLYPAGIIGVVLSWRTRPGPEVKLLTLLIVLNLAAMMAVLYWSDLRFRVGVDLILGCFAAYAYSELLTRWTNQSGELDRKTAGIPVSAVAS